MRIRLDRLMVLLTTLTLASTMNISPVSAARACGEIRKACEAAGFVQGGGKNGNGIVQDCIKPLLNGTPQPRKATLSLPQVPSETLSACKTENPDFGSGKDTGVTDTADSATLLRIATSLLKLGNQTEGQRLMEHGADVRAGDASMFMALGDFYNQIGNTEKATAAIQKSKQLVVPN